jgi:hypothetical protein
MDSGTLFATVFDTILDPVTLGAATIVGLALLTGFAARMVELFERTSGTRSTRRQTD